MASKSVRKVEMLSVRSSRKTKISSTVAEKCVESENSACELNSSHPFNPLDDRNKYELHQKLEKTSLSAVNSHPQAPTSPAERGRRITRSAAENYKRIPAEMEMQNEQITPEDKPITKLTEEHTLKKLTKVSSAEELGSLPPADLSLTVRKAISRPAQSFLSPYSEVRKSYRKVQKRQILSIPYRKCHDVFEGRIVFLINKLESGKYCAKDLESLIEKMQKITNKDLMNRYVISGIKTIVNLCRCCHTTDSVLIAVLAKLEEEETNLKEKILQELGSTTAYESKSLAPPEEMINCGQYKSQLLRKMYKVYKKKYWQKSKREIREITLRECEKLFDLTATASRVIAVLRKQMTLLCDP